MSEWIKCDERLPESYNGIAEWSEQMVLLVRHTYHGADAEPYYDVVIGMYHTRIRQWFDNDNDVIGVYKTETVVAWQPLPKPPEGCITLHEHHEAMLGTDPTRESHE